MIAMPLVNEEKVNVVKHLICEYANSQLISSFIN